MADFWSGFTEGFTPTYLNTRARTDRKQELDRARQQLLSDRDIVRQQRLSDMMASPGEDWKKGFSVRCAIGDGQTATCG